MSEGKVTLTCGHTDEPPVGIWEPEIDRQGQRCRSYSTFCPVCAEDASLAMAEHIEEIEAENKRLWAALAEAVYLLDPEAEDILKCAGIYRIVLVYEQAGGFLPDALKDALQEVKEGKSEQ